MTDDDLKAIEARANAATPGPWGYLREGAAYGHEPKPTDHWAIVEEREDDPPLALVTEDHEANARFIAQARLDVVALVAEVRRLQVLAKAGVKP